MLPFSRQKNRLVVNIGVFSAVKFSPPRLISIKKSMLKMYFEEKAASKKINLSVGRIMTNYEFTQTGGT